MLNVFFSAILKDSKTEKNTSSLATNSWQLEKTLEKKRELQKVSLLNYQLLALHDNEKKTDLWRI